MRKTLPVWLLGAGIGTLASVFFVVGAGSTLSQKISNAIAFPRTPDPRILIVTIDDRALATVAPWPWPRTLHARLIRQLSEAGARMIVYDVDFFDPSTDPSEDDDLVSAVRSAGNVILGRDRERTPVPRLQEVARGIGENSLSPDPDGVVRQMSWQTIGQDGRRYPALAYVAATLDGSDVIRWLPEQDGGVIAVSYPGAPGKAFPHISAKNVLEGMLDASVLRDRIIFVGLTTAAAEGRRPEIETHAVFFDTLVGKRWIRPAPQWLQIFFLIMLGACVARVVEKKRAAIFMVILLGIFFGMLSAAAFALRFGIQIDIVLSGIVLLASSSLVIAERRWHTSRMRAIRICQSSRQMALTTACRFIELPCKELEELHASIVRFHLFSWRKRLSQEMPLSSMRALERLMLRWREVVWSEQGMTPLGMERTLVGWWNVPFFQSDHASRAARAALRFGYLLRDEFGIADFHAVLDCRAAIFGSIGIGSCREEHLQTNDEEDALVLQEFASENGVRVLMTTSFRNDLGSGFLVRLIDRLPLGRDRFKADVYELVGPVSEIVEDDLVRVRLYEEALSLYGQEDYSGAKEKLLRLLDRFPDDAPARRLLTRCENVQCPSDRALG